MTRGWWLAVLFVVVAVFLLLQLFSFGPFEGDENIYFYQAYRVADGAALYQEIQHSHPPLHLLPAIAFFAVTDGFDLDVVRLLPMVAALLTGLLLARAGRTMGVLSALLAPAFYLFSYHGLVLAGHFLGSNFCALWLAFSLERVASRRPAQAGVAMAIATLTLLSAAPAGVGIGAALLWRRPRDAWRYAAAGLMAFVILNLVFAAIWGAPFFDNAYLYHLGKSGDALHSFVVFRSIADADPWILYAGIAGAASLALRRPEAVETGNGDPTADRDFLIACVGGAAGVAVFLYLSPRIFSYYFLVLFVCLAPLAAAGVSQTVARLTRAVRERRADAAVEGLLLIIIASVGLVPVVMGRGYDPLPNQTYEFPRSGIDGADRVVRAVFFTDEKKADAYYAPWTRYLWLKSYRFDEVHDLVRVIQARVAPGETIFGDSTTVPLAALLAGRRIANDEADTNKMRFERESSSILDLVARLEAAPPALIIGRSGHQVFSFREFRRWVEEHYEIVEQIEEDSLGYTYLVWAPKPPGPPID